VPELQSANASAVIIEEFSKRLRLARASELALARRFLEAESLLCGKGLRCSDPDELDLLARIYLKQNGFADAKGAWSRASSAAQASDRYSLLLEELAKYEMEYAKRKRMILFASAILFSLAMTFFLLTRLKG
jgi:hypothetical protein